MMHYRFIALKFERLGLRGDDKSTDEVEVNSSLTDDNINYSLPPSESSSEPALVAFLRGTDSPAVSTFM